MKHIWFSLMVMFVVTGMTGCRSRYFSDRTAAVHFLETHKQGFEKTAEEWIATAGSTPTSCFCNFDQGSYRWGKAFIRKAETGYTVELNGVKSQASSLEEAARVVGAPFADLKHWIELANQYKIYCIQPGTDGAVQILLAGSDWSPYGFRYAPAGNERSQSALQYYSQHGGVDNSDRRMEPVGGRWFYFEAKR